MVPLTRGPVERGGVPPLARCESSVVIVIFIPLVNQNREEREQGGQGKERWQGAGQSRAPAAELLGSGGRAEQAAAGGAE